MKPPFTYYGGKLSIAEQIVALMPEHQHYVEPFAGSLAVLLAKPPAAMETVNDIDARLMTFWRVLRDRTADLERVCALTPHSRAEMLDAREPADDELENARRVWVLLTQARGGSMRPTGWRHYCNPRGSHSSMPDYLDAYRGRIAAAAARIRSVSLEARPALEVVAAYGQHPEVLLYCDPPYLGSSRTSRQYLHEMSDEAAHRDLAEALLSARATVVLSGYHSPLYDEMYAGWDRVEIAHGTGQGGSWVVRTEVIWSNRPLDRQLSLFDALAAAASS